MDAYLHTHYNIHSLQVLINADREPKVMEDFVPLGYSAKDLAAMSEEEFTKHIKTIGKGTDNSPLFCIFALTINKC